VRRRAELVAGQARSVVGVASAGQLYKMLDTGRLDVASDTSLSGDAALRRLGLDARPVRQG